MSAVFCWIPGYRDLPADEAVDAAAKDAGSARTLTPVSHIPVLTGRFDFTFTLPG
jgi:hypothetical protein